MSITTAFPACEYSHPWRNSLLLSGKIQLAVAWSFWARFRLAQPVWWLLPGMTALATFAWCLTLVDAAAAGRAYAAYGGVYIAGSLGWLWLVGGRHPDRRDLLGATVCLAGAAISLLGPRSP